MPVSRVNLNRKTPDVAIIGAGILGLWCAYLCVRAGFRPLLIDRSGIAAGASGGIVGALMPHQPSAWSPKKALQLAGLLDLPAWIERLQAKTGLSAGYLRSGRIMPIWTEAERARHMMWGEGASRFWPRNYSWTIGQQPSPLWLDPECAPLGVANDSLAARLDPRKMCAVLAKAIENHADFDFGTGVAAILPDRSILMNDANKIVAGAVLITTGINSFKLVEPFVGRMAGGGVKGQAALLRPSTPLAQPDLPVLYADGLYVIAHDNGMVAVGSTSENDWQDDTSTDTLLDELLLKARRFCPLLREAEVIERWAGVRPKHESRDPIVVQLTEAPGLIVVTGGFKISFAVAHLMAAEAVGYLTGTAGPWRDTLAQGWRQY
jgi:glycine oxidase